MQNGQRPSLQERGQIQHVHNGEAPRWCARGELAEQRLQRLDITPLPHQKHQLLEVTMPEQRTHELRVGHESAGQKAVRTCAKRADRGGNGNAAHGRHHRPGRAPPPAPFVESASCAWYGAHVASLLTQLREATRTEHAQLDHSLDFRPERLTKQRYLTFLGASLRVLAPLEDALEQVAAYGALVQDLDQRRRQGLLREDLKALGVSGDAKPCLDVPHVDNVSQAFGVGYVLEGSTLGGVQLARLVRPALSLDADLGLRYVTAHGPATGGMWKRYTSVLDAFGETQDQAQRESTLQAARSAFAAFRGAVAAAGLTDSG
jgi:heme oxygenase